MDIRYFDTLESTNNYCKLLDLDKVKEFTVICARSQTAGIGQQGNVWVSEPYRNLTFSIILKPLFLDADEQYKLTMTTAVAVAESVESLVGGDRTRIKWPNDIYVDEKKICGILATSRIQQGKIAHTVCGIGLNVNQTDFPEWVPNPVSLKQIDGKEHNLNEVLDLVINRIVELYHTLRTEPKRIEDRYLSLLYRRGIEADYQYKGTHIRGTILGVNRFGHLLLKRSDGELLTCNLKEISIVHNNA